MHSFQTLRFDRERFEIVNLDTKRILLKGNVGQAMPRRYSIRDVITKQTNNLMQCSWNNGTSLEITHKSEEGFHVYDVHWSMPKGQKGEFVDSFYTKDVYVYGCAELSNQEWPLSVDKKLQAFVTSDNKDGYGSIQERYWLFSTGIAIYVNPDVPLFVKMTADGRKEIQFVSKYEPPYRNPYNANISLRYTIFQHRDVKNTHLLALNQILSRPKVAPSEEIFWHPIWSTGQRYGQNISGDAVQKFAEEIMNSGFCGSLLLVDSDWTSSNGEMDFNLTKFPDPQQLVHKLHKYGLEMCLKLDPFTNLRSKAYLTGKDYWVKTAILDGFLTLGKRPGKVLDTTNRDARLWFQNQVAKLQNSYGIKRFDFSSGVVSDLPFWAKLSEEIVNPNVFTTRYFEMASSIGRNVSQIMESAYRSQYLGMFVKLRNREANWGTNGIQALIPSALTLGLLGYPFIISNPIGGTVQSDLPDWELYIRWTQVCTFFPCMHFSISPWQYSDTKVLNAVWKMCKLHTEYTEYILEVARECTETGVPIIHPVWWLDPTDDTALSIKTEYLVGDDILVAPVLEYGTRQRSIYLPEGRWKDGLTGDMHSGKGWLYSYRVKIDELPYFIRVNY